ncbi:MAG: hypothetical protein JNK87_29845 [Bryobacterales bacterium]|nr:hypothetical protein [Bryobacterales bacterium]
MTPKHQIQSDDQRRLMQAHERRLFQATLHTARQHGIRIQTLLARAESQLARLELRKAERPKES